MMRSHPMRAVLFGAALTLSSLAVSSPLRADDALSTARQALALSKYDTARSQLAGSRGTSLEKSLLEVRLALWTGQYEDAAKSARAGMRRGGDDAERQLAPWLAEALRRQGKRGEAIAALEKAALIDGALRANMFLGELLIAKGERRAAESVLMRVVDAYNNDALDADSAEQLSIVARSVYMMRSYQEANEQFNEAERKGGRKRVETLLWRAELFLDRYDPGHAAAVAKEALALAPNDPRAHVMMAQVKLAQTMDFAAAEKHIDKALAIDPNLAEAYFVRAGLALRTMDLADAERAANAGLKVDPRNLELLSVKAAARFLGEDLPGVEQIKTQVLALNPRYSRFFSIVGEFAEWEHRYDEIVRMMREAVQIDGEDAKAHATLGLNLIRAGRDAEGVEALDKAWRRDDFNVRVHNTRILFKETIPKEYVTVDGTRFRIRYHKDEKAVLERYLPKMLDAAWGSMVARYGFTPQQPVSIEMYASTQDFSFRTSGLPAVGIQGVCFGKTLAALSPGAGSFNWGMVVWHELAHVFHIQMSQSRVPRWFTEGLAEYETIVQRPEWQREEHQALFLGLRDEKLPKVASFNRAFTHAEHPRDVTMAYFAASQIAIYLAEELGFDKVVAHLPLWADGKQTSEVVKNALGIEADELDRRFRAWLEPRLERYREQYVPDLRPPNSLADARAAVQSDPKNASKLAKLALALFGAGQNAEAAATLELALQADPKHADALYLKLRMSMALKKLDEAEQVVADLLAAGHDGYSVRMKAADVAELKEDKAKMREHFSAAHNFDPTQAEPLAAMYDLARKDNDELTELNMLRQLSRLEQHDRRVWKRLLGLLVKRGEFDEAVKVGESALFVDVMNPEVHYLYARALARTGRHVSAIFELNSALLAKPPAHKQAKIYRMMVEGYRKLGRDDYAQRAERYAEQMDQLTPVTPDDADDAPLTGRER